VKHHRKHRITAEFSGTATPPGEMGTLNLSRFIFMEIVINKEDEQINLKLLKELHFYLSDSKDKLRLAYSLIKDIDGLKKTRKEIADTYLDLEIACGHLRLLINKIETS